MALKRKLARKPAEEVRNQNMMGLIRKVHGMIDNTDIEKHRLSQDHVGALLGNSRDMLIRSVKIQDMDGEWVSVNRAHMKKYVILYCHGGGYSTGSSLYAKLPQKEFSFCRQKPWRVDQKNSCSFSSLLCFRLSY